MTNNYEECKKSATLVALKACLQANKCASTLLLEFAALIVSVVPKRNMTAHLSAYVTSLPDLPWVQPIALQDRANCYNSHKLRIVQDVVCSTHTPSAKLFI